MRANSDTHRFPIAPILRELGFEDVPDVRSGHRKVRCHFHGERNPSASVSKYGFLCFACDRRGDAIKLVREEEGLDYAGAVQRCQEITGGSDSEVPGTSGWGQSLLD